MKKVDINPVICFANGQQYNATKLGVTSVSDNLYDKVIFKYVLFDELGRHSVEGKVEVCGWAYEVWDATIEEAFKIVAKELDLEIEFIEDDKMFNL